MAALRLRALGNVESIYTPFSCGSQMNLWIWRPRRALRLSASIHSASERGSSRQFSVEREPVAPLRKAGERMRRGGSGLQSVLVDEVAGVLVVCTRGEDELELVARGEGGEVLRAEAQVFAAAGTFDIDDFVDLAGDEFEGTLAAGFEQQLVTESEKLAHEAGSVRAPATWARRR